MNGGSTFRDTIDSNKRKIIEYLTGANYRYTSDIYKGYTGEKDMPAIRKALNELREEGLITTDDKTHFWRGKQWRLKQSTPPYNG